MKTKKPNQDSFLTETTEDFSYICVSDGHGSAAYLRSDIGSKIATEVARDRLLAFGTMYGNIDATSISKSAINELKIAIASDWRAKTKNHYDANPINEEEIAEKIGKNNPSIIAKILNKPKTMYGATLLAAYITKKWVLLLKLGDGDILLSEDSGIYPMTTPFDDEQYANATHSLCEDTSEQYMSCVLSGKIPKALTVSTDGVANSYSNPDGMKNFLTELYNEFVDGRSVDEVSIMVEKIVNQCAVMGSGDDSTLAFAINARTLKVRMPSIIAECCKGASTEATERSVKSTERSVKPTEATEEKKLGV